jgi:hypothetical protein
LSGSSDRPTNAVIASLKAGLADLTERAAAHSLTPRARKALDAEIRVVMAGIGKLLHELDPIRQPAAMFDPSNPKIIGRFISLALVAQPRLMLSEVSAFYGSGVYAIYYKGDFEPYQPISGSESPIYVGQAAPAQSNAQTPMEQGDRLTRRLADHRRNITKAASTLRVEDFEYRALVVQSGWETAAEDYLIHLFGPIWNSETNILYGLGKHGDDAKTRANKRSPWDTLHPGRAWAAASESDARTPRQIVEDLERHFGMKPVYRSLDDVLREFLDELRQV